MNERCPFLDDVPPDEVCGRLLPGSCCVRCMFSDSDLD